MYMQIYICIYICVHICMYIHMYVSVHVYVYMYKYLCLHTHTNILSDTSTFLQDDFPHVHAHTTLGVCTLQQYTPAVS